MQIHRRIDWLRPATQKTPERKKCLEYTEFKSSQPLNKTPETTNLHIRKTLHKLIQDRKTGLKHLGKWTFRKFCSLEDHGLLVSKYVVFRFKRQESLHGARNRKLLDKRNNIAIAAHFAHVLSDNSSTDARQARRLAHDFTKATQKLFHCGILSGKIEPFFLTQLPTGVHQKGSRLQFVVPRQPTERRIPQRTTEKITYYASIQQCIPTTLIKESTNVLHISKIIVGFPSSSQTTVQLSITTSAIFYNIHEQRIPHNLFKVFQWLLKQFHCILQKTKLQNNSTSIEH